MASERTCSRNFKLSNISVEYGYVGKVRESSGSRQSRQGRNQERLLDVKELGFLPCVVTDFKQNNDMTSIALGETSKNCVYV